MEEPTTGPLVCGTASCVAGSFVWTDYVYDDTGASVVELGGGAAAYDEEGANAADLVQLQLTPGADGLAVCAVLQTLRDPAVPVLAVGFDTDGDPATGAPTLPGNAWPADPPLGLEIAVVVRAREAVLFRYGGGSWQRVAALAATVDTERQTIGTTVPPEHLEPSRVPWRVVAALGPARDGRSFADGEGAIHDLAFVGGEMPARPRGAANAWQDRDQADVLAGRLDSRRAVATVDFGALARGGDSFPDTPAPGTHTFLYRSTVELGGGIQPWPRPYRAELWTKLGLPAPARAPWTVYAGRYQPYGVWIPERLPQPAPLVVFLHGTGSNHLANASRGYYGPGRFDLRAVVVEPLGRGGSCGYFGAAEQDVLDVMDDIAARVEIDPDRVILTGISQGGFGTFRLGELYPDRFAALVPLVGQSALVPEIEMMISGGEPFMPDTLENLCNLPVRMVNGRLDPQKNTIAGNVPDLDALALQRLGYDFRYWQLLRRGHEVVPELTNGIFLELLDRPRERDPARVVFSVEPFLEVCDERTGLRLRHDAAYWVSGIVVRRPGDDGRTKGTVDVTSLARPDRAREPRPYAVVGGNTREPRDLVGPNPHAAGFDEWVEQGIVLAPGPPQPVVNGLAATFTNVAQVTLDLPRMRIDSTREIVLHVAADGPTELTLLGSWPSHVAVSERAGAARRAIGEPRDGGLRVEVGRAGTAVQEELVLTPLSTPVSG